MMKKILSFITLFLCTGSLVEGWQPQSPAAQPPAPLILLNPGEHMLCGKSRDGKVELEDGSKFKALSGDALKIYEEWSWHDHLTVTPNTMLMGGSDFFLINLDRHGEFVHVNFFSEPSRTNPYTQSIFFIDPHYGEIYVRNGNKDEILWFVEEEDIHLLKDWEQGDRVLIGSYVVPWHKKFSIQSEHVMINCEKEYLRHVRVKQ
ncbi:MAG: hypothetical protein KDK76_04630 [Chlamydiia bacterium]|nr:hypothetical protein [Chlamydiia bacterium]